MSGYPIRRAVSDLGPLFGSPLGRTQSEPNRYPNHPGSKAPGTSVESAAAVASEAQFLRGLVMIALRDRPMTADEIAERLGRSPLSIRPRVSELRALGRIVATGERRRNASGMSAAVWALAGSEVR